MAGRSGYLVDIMKQLDALNVNFLGRSGEQVVCTHHAHVFLKTLVTNITVHLTFPSFERSYWKFSIGRHLCANDEVCNSYLFLWNSLGFCSYWKKTCCFSLSPSSWTLMMLLRSWSSLSCSVSMSGAADTSSFLLLTFTGSWMNAGFQKFKLLQIKCLAYSAPDICVTFSVMNLRSD